MCKIMYSRALRSVALPNRTLFPFNCRSVCTFVWCGSVYRSILHIEYYFSFFEPTTWTRINFHFSTLDFFFRVVLFAENKADLQLKLPINRTNFDVGCDQGYGSERSPEDELPPSLPILSIPYQASNQQPQWDYDKNGYDYSFITQGE